MDDAKISGLGCLPGKRGQVKREGEMVYLAGMREQNSLFFFLSDFVNWPCC